MGDRCRTRAIEFRTNRLQNTYLTCHQAEKTLQLIRLLLKQTREDESAKFIVYFATCAAVDYFYNVSFTRVPRVINKITGTDCLPIIGSQTAAISLQVPSLFTSRSSPAQHSNKHPRIVYDPSFAFDKSCRLALYRRCGKGS